MCDSEDNENYKFVIFPLNCLSLNFSFKFLIQCIYDYYITTEIIRLAKTKENNVCNYKTAKELYEALEFWYFDSDIEFIESYKNTYLKYKLIKERNKKFEAKYGRDAKVQIHIDLLTDLLNKNILTERQFRILCAINSKIGKSIYQIIYNDEIVVRSNGYKTKEVFNKETKGRNVILYSKYILGKEIPYLKSGKFGRNFFDRILVGKRKYYYSKKYRGKKLEELILLKLNRGKATKDEERIRNNRFNKKLKKMKSRYFTKEEINKLVEIRNKTKKYS